jgi:hypothetical protein
MLQKRYVRSSQMPHRIQHPPDDPDKFSTEEMTEKTEEGQQTRGIEIVAISNRYEEKP